MNDFDNMLLDMLRDDYIPPEVERRVEGTLASLPEAKRAKRSSGARTGRIRAFALAAAALAAALAVVVAVKGGAESTAAAPESDISESGESAGVLSGVTLLGYNEGEYELSGSGANIVILQHSSCEGVSGCVFGIEGENIQSVSLEIDRGSLYRMTRRSATKSEVVALENIEDKCYYTDSGFADENSQSTTLYTCEVLGSSVQESYSADSYYGFYVDSARMAALLAADGDMQAQAHAVIDEFDGAQLTVRATYTDGSESETVYVLHSGRLGVSYLANGTQLVSSDGFVSEDEPYVYGIIASPMES